MTLPRSPPGSNSNADSHAAHCSSIVIGATLPIVSQTDPARQQVAALQSPRMLVATAMCKTRTHRAIHPGMHSSPPSPSSRGRSSMNSSSRMCPFIAVRSLLFCRQSRAGISLGLSAACRHTGQQDPLALQAAGVPRLPRSQLHHRGQCGCGQASSPAELAKRGNATSSVLS